MVAPIRELGNFTHSTAIMSQTTSNLVLSQDIDMDIDPVKAMFNLNDNYEEVRGCSLDMSIHRPGSPSPSLSSSECDEEYHVCVQQESNKMIEDEPVNSSGNFELEYTTPKSQNNQVSKVADSPPNMRQRCGSTVNPALNQSQGENMVNIQLNYNPDQALDPGSWDGHFRAVSLHGSIEHLASNALNIKESLTRIQKYIAGKFIDGNKANDVKDLNSMGKAIWEFISTVYESHWDTLYTLTTTIQLLEAKSSPNFLLKSKISNLCQTKIKKLSNQHMYQLFLLLFQPNHPKKLKKFRNTSKKLKNLL